MANTRLDVCVRVLPARSRPCLARYRTLVSTSICAYLDDTFLQVREIRKGDSR